MTETPNGATQNYTIVGPSSLHVYGTGVSGGWTASTASNGLLANQTFGCSYSYFVKVNSVVTPGVECFGNAVAQLFETGSSTNISALILDSSSGGVRPVSTITPGVVYHIAGTWDSVGHVQNFYINGQLYSSFSDIYSTSNSPSSFNVGWGQSSLIDYEVQDIGIWDGHVLTHTEVLALRNGTSTPGSLGIPATTWWPFYGIPGTAPGSYADLGFRDVLGSNPFTSFSSTPTTAIAKYDTALVYTPPVQVTPYITKTGQNVCFGFATNYESPTVLSGTVSINSGSRSLTTSVPQAGFVGQTITIAGDSSAGTYTVLSGNGRTWQLRSAYGGSTNAVGLTATNVTQNNVVAVTGVVAAPTINVQFGGSGSFETVQIGGPYYTPVSHTLPCVLFPLECGSVQSVVIQNHGAGYVSPTATASGGGGSGLTFGTPLLTGGVTSFTIVSGGSGYNMVTTNGYINGPTVTIPIPEIPITGTLTAGSESVTGISNTTGLVPGMLVLGALPNGTTIASIVSTTAITLSAPAAYSGSTSLTIYGKQALATATVTGGVITGVSVWSPGTGYGYFGSTVTGTFSEYGGSGGTGSGGTVTCHITEVIASIPVTNAGSGYTSPPTITIADSGGSGAVAVPLMAGIGPADVVQYTAVDSWAIAASGPAGAVTNVPVANYSGQLEPGFGGFIGFNLPANEHNLQMGINIGHTYFPGNLAQCTTNWLSRINCTTAYNGNVTSTDPGGRPYSITGTAASPTSMSFVNWNYSNGVDGYTSNSYWPTPGASGVNGSFWTFIADETNPSNRMHVGILSGSSPAARVTGGDLSFIPNYTPGVSTTGVTSITPIGGGSWINVTTGTGYLTPPTVTIVGGGGTGATACAFINSNGQVYWVSVTSVGSNYTSTPTVAFSGGNGGSGAVATAVIGSVLAGSVWQFTVNQTGYNGNATLYLTFWTASASGGAYRYTLANECLFDPPTAVAAYPSLPDRSTALSKDVMTLPYLTSATSKYPAILRCMQWENTGVGLVSNVVDVCDLNNSGSFSFNNNQVITQTPLSLSQAPTFSRQFLVTAVRTYAISATGIAAIYVTNAGSGYSGTVPLTFVGGGSLATGYATVTLGVVQSVTITNGGSGYTSSVTASIVGYSGSGATFAVTVGGGIITAVTVTNPGVGYTSTLPIVITDSTGNGAAAIATVSTAGTISGGGVLAVNVTGAGSGYTSAPTVSFSGGGGSSAVAAAQVGNGIVANILMVISGNNYQTGTGYTTIPTVNISGGGGTGATAFAVLTGISVTNTGANYVSPSASISGGGGSGATLSVIVGYPSGVLGGISITTPGSGYTSAPTVVISAPTSGTQAFAVAIISGGTVAGFTIVNTGSGYTTTPTVTLSGGGYSVAATATASVWNTTWSSPNVYFTDAGSGTSTLVPNSSWKGYGSGSGYGGGPYMLTPPSPGYLNPYETPVGAFFAGEMVTSAPHNLKSGQLITTIVGGSGTYSVTIGRESATTGVTLSGNYLAWVTGPNTIAFQSSNNAVNNDGGLLPGHFSAVSGTFPVNYTMQVASPNVCVVTYDIQAKYVGSLPGTDFWVNIPNAASNTCIELIAASIRDNFPMGRKVWVEFHNEHWNSSGLVPCYMANMGQLGAWSSSTLTPDQAYAERARQIHDIFVEVFNQTDVNGNSNRGGEIVRLFGAWYIGSFVNVIGNMVSYANTQGIKMDAVCVADYIDITSDSTSPTAAATVNVTGGGSTGGTLPAGTYYVYYTWVDGVTGIETDIGTSLSAQFTVASGNIPIVTIPSFPLWGAGTANLYLTVAGGAAGTQTRFTQGTSGQTTFTLNVASWTGPSPPTYNLMPSMVMSASLTTTNWPASIAYGNANPRSRASYLEYFRHMMGYGLTSTYVFLQQQLNNYSVGTYPIPLLVGYEGGIETLVPTFASGVGTPLIPNPLPLGNFLRSAITADLVYDPAMYDTETSYYLNLQQAGVALTNIFNYASGEYAGPGIDGGATWVWPLFLFEPQPMGYGNGSMTSNGYDVTNQFWIDTQLSPHNFNAAVRMQAWNDWVDQASPFIIPGDVYVTPANGATLVSPRVVIVVQFDEPMLGSTINNSTFTLKLAGNSVRGTIAYNPITWAATFTPIGSLSGLSPYTAQVTTGAENSQGIAILNPITWSFTTSASTSGLSRAWYPGLSRPTLRGY